jgi:hypothetical protein
MTDTDRALFSKLSTTAGITALNGARVTPLIRAPGSGKQSSIVYTLITENDEPNLAETSQLKIDRYQVTCYGQTRTEARALADAVKTALHITSGVIDGQSIQKILYANNTRREDHESETGLFTVTREYDVFFN